MWRSIVRRRVHGVFDHLSRGDHVAILPGVHERVHHRFAGDHALGGERHDRDALERWFERLFRLVALDFTLERVAVAGRPWDAVVAVEWVADVTPVAGPPYENRGTHVLRIRRFRVTEIHAYEDSQAVVAGLAVLAEHGVEEATAPPIVR